MNNTKEVFIDESCSICNSFSGIIQNYSRDIKVSSTEMLDDDLYSLNSIVFKSGNSIFLGMDAIVEIIYNWGSYYKLIRITKILPNSFNDIVYRLIARNRHKISHLLNTKLFKNDFYNIE